MLEYFLGLLTGAVIIAAIWWRAETVSLIRLKENAEESAPFDIGGKWYKLVPYHDKK